MTLEGLNQASGDAFVAALGGIFEGSPWVAQRTAGGRPFASLDDLHQAMMAVVRAAGPQAQLGLIRARPELGVGRLAALSPDSAAEQAGAGLNDLAAPQRRRFEDLNARYRARFGFPFIIAVKCHTRDGILSEFARRLQHDAAAETEQALQEIAYITRLRLETAVAAPAEARRAPDAEGRRGT